MRKMYSKPQTQTTPMKVANTLCSSQTVGFGNGSGSGPALSPGHATGPEPNLEVRSF